MQSWTTIFLIVATAIHGVSLNCPGGELVQPPSSAEIDGLKNVRLSEPPPPRSGLIAQVENDLWGGTDENYTNGLRLVYGLGKYDQFLGEGFITFSLAQLILNPQDIYRAVPDPNDRPYAGYLHAGIGYHVTESWFRNSFGLDIGVVGPSSLAETAQKTYHDLRDIAPPIGWEEQINDEPVIQLSYEGEMRPWVKEPKREGWEGDHLIFAGGTLGNGFINVEAGTEVRAGWNLAPRWATSLISPGMAAGSPLPWAEGIVEGKPKLSVETFAGVRGRLVGRDITLDGNTFKDSASVDKNIAVADVYAGAGWGYGWFSMTFTEAYRTPEFEGQDGGQFFGSLTMNISF